MRQLLSELTADFKGKNLKTRERLCRKYADTYKEFKEMLFLAYNEGVEWVITETPEYKPFSGGKDHGHLLLRASMRQIQNIFASKTFYPNLPDKKRNLKFLDMLEYLYPTEAELLIQMKNRKILYVTKKIVQVAVPEVMVVQK